MSPNNRTCYPLSRSIPSLADADLTKFPARPGKFYKTPETARLDFIAAGLNIFDKLRENILMRGWWAATFLAALMPGTEPSWLRITGEIGERWEDPTGTNRVWLTGTARWQPRPSTSYMKVSGGSDPRDGRKNTFETLDPTTHLRNAATDRLGWANIHDGHLMGDRNLNPAWRLHAGGHDFHLPTVEDSLYSKSCSAILTNRTVTSTDTGAELYAALDWQARTHWHSGAGYAHLFRGAYLRQSSSSSASQPYGFWATGFEGGRL